jgi:hypothetical protein
MNRYSVKIEPRRGSSIARIWNRDNAAPEKDDTWTGCWEVDTFLVDTHIPAIYRRETAKAIANLIIYYGLVDITIFDTRDGWGVHITLCPELENQYLRGFGSTPADAIRNSTPYPPPLRDL